MSGRLMAILCAVLTALVGGLAEAADQPAMLRFGFVGPAQTIDGVVIDEAALQLYVRDMILAAAEAGGLKIGFIPKHLDDESVLTQMKADIVGPVSMVELRIGKLGFTSPILLAKGAVFYRAGEAARTVGELRGKRIVVVKGSPSQQWAMERDLAARSMETIRDAMLELQSGKADAVLTSEIAGGVELARAGYKGLEHAVLDNGNTLRAYAFATRLEDEEIRAKLDLGLQQMRQNGKADEIYDLWIAPYQPREKPGLSRAAVVWIGAILGVLIAGGAAAFVAQKKRLSRRSRDLAESEEQYRLMAENLSGVSYRYLLEPDGTRRMLSTNSLYPVWRETFPAIAKDMPFEDALLTGVHADDVERLKRALAESRETHKPMEVEFRLVDRSGAYHWIHVRKFASTHPDGIVWQGILLDVTHQRQLAASLHESEVKFQEIVEHCHDGIMAVSRPAGIVVEANPAAAAALGCDRAGLIGMPLFSFLPEMKERLLADWDEAVEARVHHRGADGTARDLEVRIKPMDFAGREAAILLLRDVTERERIAKERARLDMEMARTQKLEGLGVMAGGIAHDFNNILVGILGSLSLVARQIEEGTPAGETVKLVQRSAARAADLTSKLLAYSGGAAIEKRGLDFKKLLISSQDLLEVATGRRAEFSISTPPNGVPIVGDAVQLEQVAVNLVRNAAEAITHEQGKVTVVLDVVKLDGARPPGLVGSDVPPAGEYARLSVKDNGSGISDDLMHRIFEPFVTTKFAGRGLGLAASLGIIRAHRGAVCMMTNAETGTEFQVLLPLAEGAPDSSVEAKPMRAQVALAIDRTVLVVDDEQLVRETLRGMLRSLKANVIEADGGDAALKLLREGLLPDCVLLDLTMPGKDGLKTLQELRSFLPELPVVLCSGFTELSMARNLEGDALVSFLAKPYTLDELAQRIEHAVGRRNTRANVT